MGRWVEWANTYRGILGEGKEQVQTENKYNFVRTLITFWTKIGYD